LARRILDPFVTYEREIQSIAIFFLLLVVFLVIVVFLLLLQ
jgi:hypothetical protein